MRIILTLLLSGLIFSVFSQDKELKLNKTDKGPVIDGIVDEVWNQADSATGFHQFMPYHNEAPTSPTTVKMLTDGESLFCLFICYDKTGHARHQAGILDDSNGDAVSLMLDTFGDKKTAYKFGVSSSGAPSDSRMLDDARNRDYSWDGIWFSAAKHYNWGYIVEQQIPFKSIQYDENLSEWGLDFDRWIPELGEDIYWNKYIENEGQRISRFGKLLLGDFRPSIKGLNLEIYPVGIAKTEYTEDDKYDFDPDAGLDIFYNPSPALTFQLTANPDFAQIEADPYDFNISRYESYFNERRPFFTEGKEVFTPAGKRMNSGFYTPLELFYSRRIGKKLPDGQEAPLNFGAKAFGRIGETEYGAFAAQTGEVEYMDDGEKLTEEKAWFGSVRINKKILGNSSIGGLYVGKFTGNHTYAVIDLDGAFRGSNWQIAWQAARSVKDDDGDFAFSANVDYYKPDWIHRFRGRYIGEKFDISHIGYVPWSGTSNGVYLTGPRWSYETGAVRNMMFYFGGGYNWAKVDQYTDHFGLIGFNMSFREHWGFEINIDAGKAKDEDVKYSSWSANFSSWFHTSAKWNANLWGGYSRTYNFSREFLAFYSWAGSSINWNALTFLETGTELNVWIEGNPEGETEEITWNARPFISVNPISNMNLKLYVDNVFVRSTNRIERMIIGLLFSYNFSPKSWIYFAFNELRDLSEEYDKDGSLIPARLHTENRAAVIKIKYLYYF